VETPRKFITAKLSIRKPGSSSVLIICSTELYYIISTDEDPGLRIESFAVINLRGVSTNKTIIYFIAMQTYKELRFNTYLHSVNWIQIDDVNKKYKKESYLGLFVNVEDQVLLLYGRSWSDLINVFENSFK
jgi:hypothetical protein